ncbi:Major facilitator superfamily domain-containing protein 10 [Penicillium taxi]|uniref:Major facilitator superfamily domain-containing protein 10 n=1 Tax=Penicillium taxi TaxID=168475 RepID=UPI0025450B5C|nr:Major facilitator superfamily domain-containing protein 10 [Penicillium taxi]KAJ5888831.1 Major facilitator superfamily domain-containing protein 10 [Penicillium taxi]
MLRPLVTLNAQALSSLSVVCNSSRTIIPRGVLPRRYAKAAATPEDLPLDSRERVVILGSGWAGYNLSRRLCPKSFIPIVISPRSYFVFTPLLTATASGSLDFSTIVEPVRDQNSKVDFIQAAALSIDLKKKTVLCEATIVKRGVNETPRSLSDERLVFEGNESTTLISTQKQPNWDKGQIFEVPYDKLVIAVGALTSIFGTPGVRENAMFFRDIGDAKRVKRRVRECFELAVLPSTTPEMRKHLLNFAIVGAGPTGIELAGSLRDFIHRDVLSLYPSIAHLPKISLYDVAPKVLSMFDDSLSRYAMDTMKRDGVDILTSHNVQGLRWGTPGAPLPQKMDPKGCLTLITKEDGEIGVGMCVWVTGNTQTKFVRKSLDVVEAFPKDDSVVQNTTALVEDGQDWKYAKAGSGALLVDGHLRVQLENKNGQKVVLNDVFALGDNAMPETGAPPATAQASFQEAKWLSDRLNKKDCEQSSQFSFRNMGSMAYIGNEKALMQLPHNDSKPMAITGPFRQIGATSLTMAVAANQRKQVLKVVMISLLLDLISFTFILPLFPSLLSFYRTRDQSPTSILNRIFHYLDAYKNAFARPIDSRYDIVLLGGALGSLFSLLQAFAAPVIGHMSDRYGRRRALLTAMLGNIFSVALWVSAKDFRTFLASRVVGGLSEANVQLANAIVADVTEETRRGASMALVGACFSIAFTFGPMLGAGLSTIDIVAENPFMTAALVSLALILLETAYLWICLPETHPQFTTLAQEVDSSDSAAKNIQFASADTPHKHTNNPAILNTLHFLFLLPFSGMEFSLPFLTATLYGGLTTASPAALNGRLLSMMGLIASLLQGTLVRRLPPLLTVRAGVVACALSFFSLAHVDSIKGLYASGALLAVTSATVVTGLNSLGAAETRDANRGAVMGRLRGWGQAGRAAGPLLFCTLFWWAGRETAYTVGGIAMSGVALGVFGLLKSPSVHAKKE